MNPPRAFRPAHGLEAIRENINHLEHRLNRVEFVVLEKLDEA